MVTNYIDPPFTRQKVVEMKEVLQDPQIYGTIGIHPVHANNFEREMNLVVAMMSYEKIVAVGECGLDVTKTDSIPLSGRLFY